MGHSRVCGLGSEDEGLTASDFRDFNGAGNVEGMGVQGLQAKDRKLNNKLNNIFGPGRFLYTKPRPRWPLYSVTSLGRTEGAAKNVQTDRGCRL